MAYERSSKKLEELLEKGFQDPEFQEFLPLLKLEKESLVVDLSNLGDSVWNRAASAFSRLEQVERWIEQDKQEREKFGFLRSLFRRFNGGMRARKAFLLGILIGLILIGLIFFKIDLGPSLWILLGLFPIYSLFLQGYSIYKNLVRPNELQEDANRETVWVDEHLVTFAIKPFLRERISELSADPGFDAPLHHKDATGLVELADPKYTVPTAVRDEIEKKISRMQSGSLGIAGERGSGKTTLLRSICALHPNAIGQKPVLTMLVSVPVAYEAREFILYFFSTLCLKVLDAEKDPLRSEIENREIKIPRQMTKMPSLSPGIAYTALIFAALGYFSISLSLKMINPSIMAEREHATATALATQFNGITVTPTFTPTVTPTLTPSPTPATSATPTQLVTVLPQRPTAKELVIALGIDPLTLFKTGILLFLPLIIISGLIIGAYPTIPGRTNRSATRKNANINKDAEIDNPNLLSELLKALSHQWLSNIRFQQSYSSGWGGELGFPAGVSISAEQAIELSENQISLPEIVDGYQKFMEQVTRKYDVIIGIDEMDKMGSGENARQFLNEIKSVFGIPGCFYLISVSENAMSSFERRGLPFRDEFDSAFDDVIYVDYLKYATALKLLRQRVLAIPQKFSSFCFAMSGGLPRDLIRICREIIHMAKGIERDVYFKDIFIPVIEMDLSDKVRAAAVSATRISSEPGVSKFLSTLHNLERNIASPEAWKKAYLTLSAPPESGNGTTEANDHIVKLYFEFSAYLYYMITLYEYFLLLDNPAQPDRESLVEKYLDWLADTKQALADSPILAISLLEEWRGALGLKPITQ